MSKALLTPFKYQWQLHYKYFITFTTNVEASKDYVKVCTYTYRLAGNFETKFLKWSLNHRFHE